MISEQRDPPSRVANAPPGMPRGGYAMSPAARDASSGVPSHNPNPLLASHENSITIQGPDGLWYNISNTGYPRVLQGPFQNLPTAESAARRRSNETNPFQLHNPWPPASEPTNAPQWLPLLRILGALPQMQRAAILQRLMTHR